MEAKEIIILGGLGFLAYLLLKKKDNVIDINPDILPKQEEKPKTIFLNLNEPQKKANYFYDDVFARDFDTSSFKTVSPPRGEVII
jgi:DNA primase catalytic subunit